MGYCQTIKCALAQQLQIIYGPCRLVVPPEEVNKVGLCGQCLCNSELYEGQVRAQDRN